MHGKQKPEAHALVRLATRIFDTPLLIERGKLDVILAAIGPRLVGSHVEWEPRADAFGVEPTQRKPYAVTPAGIAVISVLGPLVKRSTGWEAMCGMSSYQQIESEFRDAMADPAIKGILLDVDSPGGESAGCFDLAEVIYSARGQKPVYAAANDMAFSAAYAIASQADKVFVTQTGGVGSIGVICVHCDQSGYDDKTGVKYTAIYAGARKNDLTPHEPLSDEAAATLQAEIDREYEIFVRLVSTARKISAEKVRNTEAGLFWGQDGVAAGLADKQGTLREALAEITKLVARRSSAGAKAAKQASLAASAAKSPKGKTTMEKNAKGKDAAKRRAEEEEDDREMVDEDEEKTAESDDEEIAAESDEPDEPEAEEEEEEKSAKSKSKAKRAESDDEDEEEPASKKSKKAAQAVRLAASAEDVYDLCEIAEKPMSYARELLKQKLTLSEVRKRLLADRESREAAARTIRNASPLMKAGIASLEQAARQAARQSGKTYEQEFASMLRSNPKLYDQYLAANPAQGRR